MARYISPAELTVLAERFVPEGNIGVAFTYNEPLVGLEYVLDCAEDLHRHGLKTVLVTGGLATVETCERLRGKIDVMNIDLKAFSDRFYKELVGGDRKMVMDFIECAHSFAHIELTCLLIPGENDDPEEMDAFHRISSLILVDRNTHKYIRGRRKAIICGFYDCRDRTDMLK